MEMIAGILVDNPTWDNKLTTSDNYDDIICHWPYPESESSTYWDCRCLGTKTMYFVASTNNLLVTILGSLDGGVTFPAIAASEFSVAVGTPVLKPVGTYYNALKIQVKPAVAGVHGTLSVFGSGTSGGSSSGESSALDLSYSTGATDAKTIRVKLSNEDIASIISLLKSGDLSFSTGATDAKTARVKLSNEDVASIVSLLKSGDLSFSTGATDAKTVRVKLSNEDLAALETISLSSLPDTAGSDLSGIHSGIDGISKPEDAAHVSGESGVLALAVRKDSAEAMVDAAGDRSPLIVDALSRVHVSSHWPETLDSANDSVDVKKKTKGTVSTPHSAITATATSAEINCCGYNSLLIHWVSSATDKTWTIQVLGAMTTGATFVEWITSAGASNLYTTDVSGFFVVTGIPDFIKIVATEVDDGATVTCKVQPFNM